jgi:hypothetical protein
MKFLGFLRHYWMLLTLGVGMDFTDKAMSYVCYYRCAVVETNPFAVWMTNLYGEGFSMTVLFYCALLFILAMAYLSFVMPRFAIVEDASPRTERLFYLIPFIVGVLLMCYAVVHNLGVDYAVGAIP